MKIFKLVSPVALIFAISALLFTSCSKKDDTPASQFTTTTDGNWRVSLYFDNSDETSDFAGYTFVFNNNGQVSATNGTNNVSGTWAQSTTKFTIDFGVTAVFSKLNNDWLIEEKTSTSIKLKDDNPARNEKLQFLKL